MQLRLSERRVILVDADPVPLRLRADEVDVPKGSSVKRAHIDPCDAVRNDGRLQRRLIVELVAADHGHTVVDDDCLQFPLKKAPRLRSGRHFARLIVVKGPCLFREGPDLFPVRIQGLRVQAADRRLLRDPGSAGLIRVPAQEFFPVAGRCGRGKGSIFCPVFHLYPGRSHASARRIKRHGVALVLKMHGPRTVQQNIVVKGRAVLRHVPADRVVPDIRLAVGKVSVRGVDLTAPRARRRDKAVAQLRIGDHPIGICGAVGPHEQIPAIRKRRQRRRGGLLASGVGGDPAGRRASLREVGLGRRRDKNIAPAIGIHSCSALVPAVTCDQVVGARDLKGTDGGTRLVFISVARFGESHHDHVFRIARVRRPGLSGIAEQNDPSGIGVALVNRDQVFAVVRDQLVKRVTDIAGTEIADRALKGRDCHIRLLNDSVHIRLVADPVGTGIGLMGGAHVKHAACLGQRYARRAERNGRIRAADRGSALSHPVLGVADDPIDLGVVVFLHILLAKNQIVAVRSLEETSEDRQFDRNGMAGEELSVRIVILPEQAVSVIVYAKKARPLIDHVGGHGHGVSHIVLPAAVPGGRGGQCPHAGICLRLRRSVDQLQVRRTRCKNIAPCFVISLGKRHSAQFGAGHKCLVADCRHGFGKDHFRKRRAGEESPDSDHCDAVREADPGEFTAAGECSLRDFSQRGGELNLLQSGTIRKRPASDRGDSVPHSDFRKSYAALEGSALNLFHGIGDRDLRESGRHRKSIFSDRFQRRRQIDLLKSQTFVEGARVDLLEILGQSYVLKA